MDLQTDFEGNFYAKVSAPRPARLGSAPRHVTAGEQGRARTDILATGFRGSSQRRLHQPGRHLFLSDQALDAQTGLELAVWHMRIP